LARGRELTARLRFRERGAQPAGALSGGTRQKLNLVVSLIHDPDLLVLDEPYQGFDYESYLAFWELARELRSTGRSVVIVTHFVHDREQLSRIYRLEDGRVVDD
jgi:ABC-2 type transport system ATP-binding protein